MDDFKQLNLKTDILEVLTRLGLKKPFEVQEKIVPLAIQGKNIVFTSRTGSGKTLAYLLGYLGKINKKLGTQMLVVVPTRELCIQVGKEMKQICDRLSLSVGMLYGGRDVSGDFRTVTKKNHILVATPGRLILHVNEKNVKIGEVKYLVYDESDQMFDFGFYDDCVYIKKRVSKQVQIISSSATMTPKVIDFIDSVIGEYELLRIGDTIPKNIIQEVTFCEKEDKNVVLLDVFKKKKFKRAIVFCNTKQRTHTIADMLQEHHFNAKALNGDLDQKERINTLNLFKEGKIRILVTTDVAARGLHIKNVDTVLNYDVPRQNEFYVHRIGRSGRVGNKGYALTFVCPEDEERFELIEMEYALDVEEIDFSRLFDEEEIDS